MVLQGVKIIGCSFPANPVSLDFLKYFLKGLLTSSSQNFQTLYTSLIPLVNSSNK